VERAGSLPGDDVDLAAACAAVLEETHPDRLGPGAADLLESVYADDVDAVCSSADEVAGLPPWEALATWLHRFVDYLGTKRALAEAVNFQSELFQSGRASVNEAGQRLLCRAQEAGAARPEVTFDDVLRLIAGITMIEFTEPGQRDRVLAMALDGIRHRPAGDHPAPPG